MAFTNKKKMSIWKRNRKRALKELGNKCVVCKRSVNLIIHRKDGMPHPNTDTALLYFEEPEEYALVCKYPCHTGVHFCMKYLGMDWDDIINGLVA